ncbi:MAG: hypothetical protein A3E34_00795 [Candidatus Yanofskybacteria bacterium RIFCSPHIGHO2_12_FULL_43_11]|nr:MAG: hypothetical protein A3E34_00795 [Candidatus Yanofskybacteria bacterium RIFCSPHIGHO2_12_FULL_43_11]
MEDVGQHGQPAGLVHRDMPLAYHRLRRIDRHFAVVDEKNDVVQARACEHGYHAEFHDQFFQGTYHFPPPLISIVILYHEFNKKARHNIEWCPLIC